MHSDIVALQLDRQSVGDSHREQTIELGVDRVRLLDQNILICVS